MANGFVCTVCGKFHEGLFDVGMDAPAYYDWASPEDRIGNFKLTRDTCVMREGGNTHYFVRGVLLVPVLGEGDSFGWGAWVSLSEKNFNRYLTLKTDTEIAEEPPYYGYFSNRLPGYPDTMNLKARVELQPEKRRPLFTLQPTDHPLAREQHEGIRMPRVAEILSQFVHPPVSEQ